MRKLTNSSKFAPLPTVLVYLCIITSNGTHSATATAFRTFKQNRITHSYYIPETS